MSALTDLFTDLANKIRSKTGTSTTYTPLEMVSDGIDDVYSAGYDAGGGGATGIPITPSNASPVNLTTGDSYQMLADGYAIASYTNVTPSNSNPVTLSNDTICKMNGAGKAVASVTNITPSNSSPVSLSSGSIHKMDGAGYAIQSYSDLTPSSSPSSVSSGSIYKMGGSGYVINNYSSSSVRPSSSGASFSSGWNYMNSSGYAYYPKPAYKTGTFTASTSTTTSVTLGFKPKYLAVYFPISSSARTMWIYDERISTSQYVLGSSSVYASLSNIGSTSNYRLYSIDSNGFTCSKIGTAGVTAYYFAIG